MTHAEYHHLVGVQDTNQQFEIPEFFRDPQWFKKKKNLRIVNIPLNHHCTKAIFNVFPFSHSGNQELV